MKNQYIGDVNDYRKYGLLRCFTKVGFRPVLGWMLTADDGSTDGQKREYLRDPGKWRGHDPDLFDTLQGLVEGTSPATVADVLARGVVPGATALGRRIEDDAPARQAWFEALSDRLEGDLLFLDPDNGFEVKSVPRGRRNSSKYVYWDELLEPYERGLSVLVYQHLPRRPRAVVADELSRAMQERLPGATVHCLSAGAVLFVLGARPEHAEDAEEALSQVSRTWRGQISVLEPVRSALAQRATTALTGQEPFHVQGAPIGASTLDLWKWSFSDLLSNVSRGVVAEYLVAHALGLAEGVRADWDAWDLQTEDGVRVEVKSAAFLQSWHQESLSRITFGIRPTRAWDPRTNLWDDEPRRQADVYVFCVLAHEDKRSVDPTDVAQWRFLVAGTQMLDESFGGQATVTLSALESAGARDVPFGHLAEEVHRVARPR